MPNLCVPWEVEVSQRSAGAWRAIASSPASILSLSRSLRQRGTSWRLPAPSAPCHWHGWGHPGEGKKASSPWHSFSKPFGKQEFTPAAVQLLLTVPSSTNSCPDVGHAPRRWWESQTPQEQSGAAVPWWWQQDSSVLAGISHCHHNSMWEHCCKDGNQDEPAASVAQKSPAATWVGDCGKARSSSQDAWQRPGARPCQPLPSCTVWGRRDQLSTHSPTALLCSPASAGFVSVTLSNSRLSSLCPPVPMQTFT